MGGASSRTGGERRRPGRVRLRAVRESDLATFFEHQRDPVAHQMAAFTPRERDAFMAHWHKILRDDANLNRTVLWNDEVAGNVMTFLRGDVREVGYWIGREYWGLGIATRALSQFLRLVKDRPLYAGVAKPNVASVRVLEKCGFVRHRDEGEEVLLVLR
jgi:RimJ/RimL family protein N-acetyltransferase